MTLHTKSVYEKKTSSDGTRILVSRFYPRGVKRERFDLWFRGASPSKELLKEYKQGVIQWPEFSRKFGKQLTDLKESKVAIDSIVELSKNVDVTLLCYEKEGENCHRTIVKSRVEKLLKIGAIKKIKLDNSTPSVRSFRSDNQISPSSGVQDTNGLNKKLPT
jgi:uncharacterized protein YeaO (DUF488 family)